MDTERQEPFALHVAARDGKVSLFESLLKAESKLASRKDEDGRLAVHWAVSSNNPEMVQMLSQQRDFDPDVQDDMGWTPLMIAVSLRDGDAIAELLLRAGADCNVKNFNGQNALHFVASRNNLDMAKTLLGQDPPASARVRDKRGQYAIHRAAAIGSVPMVSLLLKHRSPLNATDDSGYTPLHHAVAEGHGKSLLNSSLGSRLIYARGCRRYCGGFNQGRRGS
ncbi:putative proteasome regulatory protein [Sodiomyces alkalinus F11]|uniref:Putative proteasome regulatory protein n=1 Tax=Sodiomyces alkalinus (strain CBS 110278 / VKM F-3762 / F11) TaxID=1314773 RepID=A0A3N2PRC8_SODAK|nr:putative proteasome regulatory protein [Sodiomyces alkalinus F11]ROT37038.1 putative proteasome regulatory protein [Sodiomyces alkalinus F11]